MIAHVDSKRPTIEECFKHWNSQSYLARWEGVSDLFLYRGDWVEFEIDQRIGHNAPDNARWWIFDTLREKLFKVLENEAVHTSAVGLFRKNLFWTVGSYYREVEKLGNLALHFEKEEKKKLLDPDEIYESKEIISKYPKYKLAIVMAASTPRQVFIQLMAYALQYKPYQIRTLIGGSEENIRSCLSKTKPVFKEHVESFVKLGKLPPPSFCEQKLPQAPPGGISFYNCVNGPTKLGSKAVEQLKTDFSIKGHPIQEIIAGCTRISIKDNEPVIRLDYILWEEWARALFANDMLHYGTYDFELSDNGLEIQELQLYNEMEVKLTEPIYGGNPFQPIWEWQGFIGKNAVKMYKRRTGELEHYANPKARNYRYEHRAYNYGFFYPD